MSEARLRAAGAWLKRVMSSGWVRALFLGLSLLFVALVLQRSWQDLANARVRLIPGWMTLSVALAGGAMLFEAALWQLVLRQLGYCLPPRRAGSIWFLSNLTRYIPGRFWQFLGMLELNAEEAIPRRTTIASIIVHQVLSNGTGLLVGLSAITVAFSWGALPWLALAAAAAILVALLGPLRASVTSWLIPHDLGLPPSPGWGVRSVVLLLGYILFWLASGLAFWCMGLGLNLAGAQPWAWTSAFAASYVAGYLALLTPSGLGVREGVLGLLLTPVTGAGPAMVVALAARLWLTVVELMACAVALALDPVILRRAARRAS